MDITPAIPQGRHIITGYGNGGFKINGEFVAGSLLVFPDRRIPWEAKLPSELTLQDLQPVLGADPKIELLLLGTGNRIVHPAPALRQSLRQHGIALEVLDTGAACRTYNVLIAEERRAAAALIAV